MRKDVANEIVMMKGDVKLINKSELARRFSCNRRTVNRYLSCQDVTRKLREYDSILNDYKNIVVDKVEVNLEIDDAIFEKPKEEL